MRLKIIKVSVVVALVSLVFSSQSMAREFADIYTECGIGAMIAPRNTAVAAVTNVTWDLGTTAISSNISSPDSCNGGQAKSAAFIHNSYKSLEKDLAQGNGAYLDSLMAVVRCSPEVQPELSKVLRKGFVSIVADSKYTSQSRFEQAEKLYNLLYSTIDTAFVGSCISYNS